MNGKLFVGLLLMLLPASLFSQKITIALTVSNTQANKMPEYPGGMVAMREYMETTDYPDEAVEQNMQGTVILNFTVTETGECGAVKVLRSSGYDILDRQAAHEVDDMPDWLPGFKYGTAVPVIYTIAVNYSLENDEEDEKRR